MQGVELLLCTSLCSKYSYKLYITTEQKVIFIMHPGKVILFMYSSMIEPEQCVSNVHATNLDLVRMQVQQCTFYRRERRNILAIYNSAWLVFLQNKY